MEVVEYLFLSILVINMIVVSKTWPHETRTNLRKYIVEPQKPQSQRRDVSSGTERKGKTPVEDDDIIFPDSMGTITSRAGGDKRHDYSAQGKGYECIENVCAKAKDYPSEHIANIIGNISRYENLFGHVDGTFVDQGSRGNLNPDDPEAKPLCVSTVLTMFPQTLKNEKDIEKYIVNDGKYKQGVVFEKCVKNAHCGEASFPADYIAECTQKYSTRRLLAIEKEKDKDAAFDSFVIPSCCVCSIKKMK